MAHGNSSLFRNKGMFNNLLLLWIGEIFKDHYASGICNTYSRMLGVSGEVLTYSYVG